MGLDAWLYLERYDGDYDDWGENVSYPNELREFENECRKRDFCSIITAYKVGYWSNAYVIDEIFREHQHDDNNTRIYLSMEDLADYKETIENRLEDLRDGIERLSEAQRNYIECLVGTLEYTIDLLEKVMAFLEKHTDYSVFYDTSY